MNLDETLARIGSVLGRVNTHPEYSIQVAKEVNLALRDDASRHSYNLELRVRNGGKVKELTQRETSKHLTEGWDYLAQNGVDLGSLSKLGHIVEPQGHPYPAFRTKDVRFGGFAPSKPEVVLSEVDTLIKDLDEIKLHPVIRAAHVHLGMVKIHPYEDGNGRVARLLQNFCLQQKGHPVAIIPATDRSLYLSLIGPTLKDRYNHESSVYEPSVSEKLFYDFIASKVLWSAEYLEGELKKRRMYELKLSNVRSRPIIFSVAHAIRDLGHRTASQGISVNVVDDVKHRQSFVLKVAGDISRDELTKTVEPLVNKFGLKYSARVSA